MGFLRKLPEKSFINNNEYEANFKSQYIAFLHLTTQQGFMTSICYIPGLFNSEKKLQKKKKKKKEEKISRLEYQ